MSEYYVQPMLLDLDAEPKYTFAEIKWGRIVAIHHHWVPLEEFYKFFEPNAFFIDVTNVLIDGEPPAVGDTVTNDPEIGYKIIHIKDTFTDEEVKQCTIEKLKLTRDQLEQEPIEYNEVLYDADEISLNRMDKARKFLEDNNIQSITWTTAENTRVDLTVEDFKNLNTAVAMRSNDLHIRYNELKAYINTLNIIDDKKLIESITWNFEIPAPGEKPILPEDPEPETPTNEEEEVDHDAPVNFNPSADENNTESEEESTSSEGE